MAHGWNRLHWAFFFTFFRSVSGFKGWAYMNTKSAWSKPFDFTLSPRAVQSPDVPGSVPSAFTPSRSSLALAHQYLKGQASSNYGSRSHTQASPSSSNFASWVSPQTGRNLGHVASPLKPQGSSSLNIQNTVSHPVSRQGSFKYTASADSSRTQLTGIPARGAGTYTGFSHQSQSTSAMVVPQSSSWTPSGVSSMTSPWGSSQFGLSPSQSASHAIISSGQTPSSTLSRDSSSFRQYSLGSQSSQSQFSPSTKPSAYGSPSLLFQGTPSQFSSGSAQHVTMSEAAPQGAQGLRYVSKSQRRNSYTSSSTRGIQTSTAGSHSISFAQTPQIMSSSQYIHVSPTSPLGVPSVAAPSGSSRYQKWQSSSSRLTQGMLPSSSPSQSSQVSSRFSSMSSAGNPSQLGLTQREGSFSGLSSQSGSRSCPFMPVKQG